MTEKKMREDKKRLNDFIAYADFVLEGHSQEFIDKYYDIICHNIHYRMLSVYDSIIVVKYCFHRI